MSCDRTTLACEYNLSDLLFTPQLKLCTLNPTLTPHGCILYRIRRISLMIEALLV